MSFLTSQEIKDLNALHRSQNPPIDDLVEPFDQLRVESASYELSLGPESFISEKDPEIRKLGSGSMLKIPAGQMAFLTTKEKVSIPKNFLAFISIKASKKLKGLVNISGFHVDPGYRGNIVFSVFNSSPTDVHLKEGDPLFLIWFCKLGSDDQKPYSKGSKSINPDLIQNITDAFPSNGVIAAEIAKIRSEDIASLKSKVNYISWSLVVIGLPVVLILYQFVFATFSKDSNPSTQNTIIKSEKEIIRYVEPQEKKTEVVKKK